jgi:excisionase family DNA binding protein
MCGMITIPYLTVRQAAEKLGVSRQRVHQLIRIYSLQTEQIDGLLVMISKKELAKIPANRDCSTRLKRKSKNTA